MHPGNVLPPGLLSAALLALACSTPTLSKAGPHAGGTLILHEATVLPAATLDPVMYCDVFDLENCTDADTRTDTTQPAAWYLVAAFVPFSSPELRGVTFGIDYDPEALILSFTVSCGDFSLPTLDWPAPGSGNAIVWNEPQTALLTPIETYFGYAYTQPTVFSVIPHPIHGGSFGDNSIPSVLDPVIAYGKLGFGTDGYLPCPEGGPPGACCLGQDCIFTSFLECQFLGGDFLGPGADCALCTPTPTYEESWGKIKTRYW